MKSHGRLSQSTDVMRENGILISVNTVSKWAAMEDLGASIEFRDEVSEACMLRATN